MIEKNVKLWLGDGPLVRVPVSQFDTAWRFVFSIIYNSVEWTIPTGATAVLNGRKPDGNVFAFAGTIENNTVTVDADVQMTAVAGDTICELSILADGKTVGTANFTLAVEAAPKSPDDVSSDSTLPAYAEMLEMFSGDIENEVDSWLNAHSSQIGGLTNEAKQALLTLLAHVAYTDDQGQTYLDALEAALYPPADLVSISAVFNQGSATICDTDTLDTLKQYLTVTALYSDSSAEVVTAYTLSGTLTAGTSTITVSYGGKTTTFSVTVTHSILPTEYQQVEYIKATGTQHIITDLIAHDKADSNSNSVKLYSMDIDFSFDAWQSAYATNIIAAFSAQGGNWIGYSNAVQNIAMGTSSGNYFSGTATDRHSYHYSYDGNYGVFVRDDENSIRRQNTVTIAGDTKFSLFYYAVESGTQNNFHFNGKLYSCAVYKSGDAVLDLYPCYRKADGVIGLYDTVNEHFYTNNGTGVFEKGADV